MADKAESLRHVTNDVSSMVVVGSFRGGFAAKTMMTKRVTWLATQDALFICEQTRIGLKNSTIGMRTPDEDTEKICSREKKILFIDSSTMIS